MRAAASVELVHIRGKAAARGPRQTRDTYGAFAGDTQGRTLCGAEPTSRDEALAATRSPRGPAAAFVTCKACREARWPPSPAVSPAPAWTETQRSELTKTVGPARTARGMTQDALARRAHVTRRTVGSMERGDTIPQAAALKRVLDALDIAAPTEQPGHSEATARWLAALAPLIEALPDADRERTMVEVTAWLGARVRAGAPSR